MFFVFCKSKVKYHIQPEKMKSIKVLLLLLTILSYASCNQNSIYEQKALNSARKEIENIVFEKDFRVKIIEIKIDSIIQEENYTAWRKRVKEHYFRIANNHPNDSNIASFLESDPRYIKIKRKATKANHKNFELWQWAYVYLKATFNKIYENLWFLMDDKFNVIESGLDNW